MTITNTTKSDWFEEMHAEATDEMENNGHTYERAIEYALETMKEAIREDLEEVANALMQIHNRK